MKEVNKNGENDGKGVIEDERDSNPIQPWAVQSHQPPKGGVIRWERFLHVRSIKVLLVENDDSTRQLVTALLRNSNYEVIQAANGLQAWKILEDLNNHIDLVLTEVMPSLSGIGLLSKIMGHHLRKSIPVIMMSSYDSMALVFKCLSRGAVDFLVKPIRKNELKNLWQHVWRRCHSSSGSESECGAETEGSSSVEAYSSQNASLKIGLEIEEGSDIQTTWTKKAIEVESSPAMCSRDQTADSADNTCTLVTNPNNNVQLDNASKGKELVIRKKRNFESKSNDAVNSKVKFTRIRQNGLPELKFTANSKTMDKMPAHQSTEYSSSDYKAVINNFKGPQMSSKSTLDDDYEKPVSIGLKKLREDGGKIIQTDCNLLRCSELSTLSRYNMPLSDIRQYTAYENILHPGSEGISKITDMGSSTHKVSKRPRKKDFRGSHQELPIQDIHRHHHVHQYHDNEFLLKKSAGESPYCGLSDGLEVNAGDSGSKHGSNNNLNGSSTGANAGDSGVDNSVSPKGKNGGGTALTKSSQKKKEPCFQKKVRCQNMEIMTEE